MTTAISPTSSSAGPSGQQNQCVPAAPPTRMEVERKLSFKSPVPPNIRAMSDSPKKPRKGSTNVPPSAYAQSGNESDTSSIASSSHPYLTSPTGPSSPLLTPNTSSVGGLSAIAERHARGAALIDEMMDEMELADVEEEGGDIDEGEESEEVDGGDLQRGMDGERVLKSGYLMKKQERRKAWKRRWFVLRTGKLAYYKDDREYSLKKVLDLKSIQTVAPVTVKKHSFAFGIVTSKRTFLVKASSQDEMDDWVRAINAARRKMSEREEEERAKRTGASPMPVPMGSRPEPIDTHQGTYTSVFSSHAGSLASSPVTSTGYFTSNPASAIQPQAGTSPMTSPIALQPSSPLDMANSLTGQMAMMSMSKSGSSSSGPRQQRTVSAATRREPSASSIGSSTDYIHGQSLGITQSQQGVSSDEDEPFYTDPAAALSQIPNPVTVSAPVDPNKIILSAYLMKRSKGRTTGRKVWRKRWFYLTSQGLTYTKSHMDSRPLRFIHLSAVLDALEYDPNASAGEASDSDDPDGPSLPSSPPSLSSFGGSRRGGAPQRKNTVVEKPAGPDENLFRIITAKRSIILCAPSEEDEIKWLAAFRALLNRQRDQPPLSPSMDGSFRLPQVQHTAQPQPVPVITQQPPTPATLPMSAGSASTAVSSLNDVNTPASTTSQGPPILERPIEDGPVSLGMGGRGRSATYIAKGAVADVVRRYHPEQQPAL